MNIRNESTEVLLDMMAMLAELVRNDMKTDPAVQGVKISHRDRFRAYVTQADPAVRAGLDTLTEIGTELAHRTLKAGVLPDHVKN